MKSNHTMTLPKYFNVVMSEGESAKSTASDSKTGSVPAVNYQKDSGPRKEVR